jgi:hypothetical protein
VKLVEKENSTQVRDDRGHLMAAFPTTEAARAFQTGYTTGVRDAAERVSKRENELMGELRGMVA